jgi:hypothetical protein
MELNRFRNVGHIMNEKCPVFFSYNNTTELLTATGVQALVVRLTWKEKNMQIK